MIASVNTSTYTANAPAANAASAPSGAPQSFQTTLSLASHTQKANPPALGPDDKIHHDRKAHARATQDEDSSAPDTGSVETLTGASVSTLPAMPPTGGERTAPPKTAASEAGGDFASVEAGKAAGTTAPPSLEAGRKRAPDAAGEASAGHKAHASTARDVARPAPASALTDTSASTLPLTLPNAGDTAAPASTQPAKGSSGSIPVHAGRDANSDALTDTGTDNAAIPGEALQTSTDIPVDHELTLRSAIVAAQSGSAPLGFQGSKPVSPLLPGSVADRASKGAPAADGSSPTNTTSAADRVHKSSPSDHASTTDSSGSGQDDTSQRGGSLSPGTTEVLPQGSATTVHAGSAFTPPLSAAAAPIHGSAPAPTAQAAPGPPPAMPQPDALAMPFVNSAKLIQSIQQSDMRVGINSPEFGAISIHTSTERGVISSEITLGHTELARTITAHLSAMPTLSGTPQAISVRVDTTSTAAGSRGGDDSQQSRGGKPQHEAGRGTQEHSTGSQPWAGYTPISARSQDSLAGRLDIRI